MSPASRLVPCLALALVFVLGGCHRRARVRAPSPIARSSSGSQLVIVEQQQQQPLAIEASGEVQLLYLPVQAAQLLGSVHHAVITTNDGRSFQVSPRDLQQGIAGRVAIRIPSGITTGSATIHLLNGQVYTTTFHIAVESEPPPFAIGGAETRLIHPRCTVPSGTWQGSISTDPSAIATVWIEVLPNCRTMRGYVHLDSPTGSVDSTIEGEWDPNAGTITARDTQLFNVHSAPGQSFCATDLYRLQVDAQGRTIAGSNVTYASECGGNSPVYLQRIQ